MAERHRAATSPSADLEARARDADVGPARAALPFEMSRSDQVIGTEYSATTETIRGLVVLQDGQITVQWRAERQTDRYGAEIRSDREVDAVRSTTVPLAALASARLERSWWRRRVRLVITASDLAAFDGIAGGDGLKLDHPGELRVAVAPTARGHALEFVTELELAIAELALMRAESALSNADLLRPAAQPTLGATS